MEIRKPFERTRLQTRLEAGSRVDHDQRAETNINTIMARYQSQGLPPRINQKTPLYGDFTSPDDLHAAINNVLEAQGNFAALPSAVRAAAQNDPVVFLDMLSDDQGVEALVNAGLVLDDPEPSKPVPPTEPADPAEPSPFVPTGDPNQQDPPE